MYNQIAENIAGEAGERRLRVDTKPQRLRHYDYSTKSELSLAQVAYSKYRGYLLGKSMLLQDRVAVIPTGQAFADTSNSIYFALDDCELVFIRDEPRQATSRSRSNSRRVVRGQLQPQIVDFTEIIGLLANVGQPVVDMAVGPPVQVQYGYYVAPEVDVVAPKNGEIYLRRSGKMVDICCGFYTVDRQARRQIVARFSYDQRKNVRVLGHRIADVSTLVYVGEGVAGEVCIEQTGDKTDMIVSATDASGEPQMLLDCVTGPDILGRDKDLPKEVLALCKAVEGLQGQTTLDAFGLFESVDLETFGACFAGGDVPGASLRRALLAAAGKHPAFRKPVPILAAETGTITDIMVNSKRTAITIDNERAAFLPPDVKLCVAEGTELQLHAELGWWHQEDGSPLSANDSNYDSKMRSMLLTDIAIAHGEIVEGDTDLAMIPAGMASRTLVTQRNLNQPQQYLRLSKSLYHPEAGAYVLPPLVTAQATAGNLQLTEGVSDALRFGFANVHNRLVKPPEARTSFEDEL